jgi:glycosyltransferase involved in cell wall biosynthesis
MRPEKPLRIAIDASPLHNTHQHRGIGSYVRGLLSGLFEIDLVNEYLLFVFEDCLSTVLERAPQNFRTIRLPQPRMGRASALLTHQIILPCALSRHHLDVFHSPGIVCVPSVPNMPLRRTVKTVVSVHDLTPWVYRDIFLQNFTWRLFYRMTLGAVRQCAHIVCDTEHTSRELTRLLHIDAKHISVIPLAPDRLFSREAVVMSSVEASVSVDKPFILHVGGGHYNKNVNALIRAYARLCHEHRIEESLVLVGEGYDPGSVLHSDREVLSRIVVLQDVPQVALALLYRRATVLVYPSLHEGFGLPPLEAMASGAPVIVSNRSSLPEVVGNAAILVDAYNQAELAAAILSCVQNPALRADMRQRGLKRAQAFSWKRTALETAAVYALVAGKGDYAKQCA